MADPLYAYRKHRDLAIARGTWSPYTDAAGTRRRIQALATRGWSLRAQARMAGLSRDTLTDVSTGRVAVVKTATARTVGRFYDQVWDQAPPAGTRAEVCSASRARAEAAARGWLPPAAWDDDLIDFPDGELEVELARRVALMESADLYRAYEATKDGERSPLIVAAARECLRLRAEDNRRRRAKKSISAAA